MGFFDRLKETLRDKTLDNVCNRLCTIGVDAHLTESREPEKKVGVGIGTFTSPSGGLVEIHGEPISWVNLVYHGERGGGYNTPGSPIKKLAYLVQDPTIQREAHLKTVRKRSEPVFGQVVDLHWEGNFEDTLTWFLRDESDQSLTNLREMVRRLNEDVSLNQSLYRLKEDIEIYGDPRYGYWAILSEEYTTEDPSPSLEQWEWNKTIARHLLEPAEGEYTGTA